MGEGARLENEYDVIETHTPDYILIQKIRVDPRTVNLSVMALTSTLSNKAGCISFQPMDRESR